MSTKPMTVIPQIVMWTAGVVGAFALARLVRREYRRVNEELEAARMTPVASKADRAVNPTLKRDPLTGIYRP